MAISDDFCCSRHSSTIFPASGNYRREWFSVLPPEDVEPMCSDIAGLLVCHWTPCCCCFLVCSWLLIMIHIVHMCALHQILYVNRHMWSATYDIVYAYVWDKCSVLQFFQVVSPHSETPPCRTGAGEVLSDELQREILQNPRRVRQTQRIAGWI